MSSENLPVVPTTKTFKLHPSIIYSVIREQAGDPVKAIAELVMNSIDAGAKNIKLTLSAEKFTIEDDGVGFPDIEYIEKFFGTFGTPHKEGDAVYGKFRIGRGQCFSISKTEWRSGLYGMIVDLGNHGKTDIHGYQLNTFSEEVPGCRIDGVFYNSLNIHEEIQNPKIFDQILQDNLEKHKTGADFDFEVFEETDFFSRLIRAIGLVAVNVELNGKRISIEKMNTPYASIPEADFILHKKKSANNDVYLNKGIFIDLSMEYAPLIINFKQSPNVNLARNQINAECPIFKKVINYKNEIAFKALLNKEKWARSLINTLRSLAKDYSNWAEYGQMEGNNGYDQIGRFITKDNLKDVFNLFEVNVYKAGKISKEGLYDLIIKVQKNPDEYLVNTNRQNGLFTYNSRATCINFLMSKGIESSLIMDDYGFLEIKYYDNIKVKNTGLENLLWMLKSIGGDKYNITLNAHTIFDFDEDLTPYQVAAKKRKIENDGVVEKLTQSKIALNHLIESQLAIPLDSNALIKRQEATENAMAEFTNRLSKFLLESFEKNEINLEDENVDWLLKSKETIGILFVKRTKVFSYFHEGHNYLVIGEGDLNPDWIVRAILTRLFYRVGLEVNQTIFTSGISEENTKKTFESIYEHSELNEKIHDCLQDISNHVELSRFMQDGVNEFRRHWLNGRRKMSATEMKLSNQALECIELMPESFQARIKNLEMARKVCVPAPKRWNDPSNWSE